MTTFRAAASAAAALMLCMAATTSFAGRNPAVEAEVTALPDTVTFSRPSASPPVTNFAAYRVTITNDSRNVVNHVHLLGATAVTGSNEKATFAESIGGACKPLDAARTQVRCDVGQLRGRGGSATFTLLFKAPPSGQKITFAWLGVFAEGQKDSEHAAHRDTVSGATVTTLQAPNPNAASSFVPSAGGTVFTGITNIANPHDPSTTTVKVPKAASVELVDAVNPQSCAADLLVCFSSDLTIPGSFANLVITLRRDASTIRKYAHIGNAKVYYAADGVYFAEVPDCDCAPHRPAPGAPCIDKRKAYNKYNAPSAGFIGDWEFTILAVDNGRYNW